MSKRREQPPADELITPGMIDTHLHTAVMREKGLDPTFLLDEAFSAGLAGGIDIGTRAGDTADRAWVKSQFPRIKLAAGLAPAEAEHEHFRDNLEILERDISDYGIDALGEIGVDGYWNYGTPEHQKELFAVQIDMANRLGLPIIIHNRDADEHLLEVLHDHRPQYGGIMHCFSSGYETAKSCLDFGLHISFAGNITFKKNEGLRAAAAKVPADRILAETDSPFLSPEPLRGRPNHPALVAYVYRTLAQARKTDVEELVERIGDNFEGLFTGE